MAKSPQSVAAKWRTNLTNAVKAYTDGISALTVNPAEKAIRQSGAYLEGVQRAVNSGKYEAGLRRVTLESFKRAAIEKGSARLAQGASAAEGGFASFMAELLPHIEAGKAMLEGMPRGGIEQNKVRMLAFIDHMAKFRRSR